MKRLFPLALAACAPKVDIDDTGPAVGTTDGDMAVLATVSDDYATGALATISLDDWSVTDTITDISGDPALSVSGGYVFQLDRFGFDVVKVYEPGQWDAPITEFALQDLANPHDVVVCAGDAFIAQHGVAALAVHAPETGRLVGTVDLSAHTDADGIPEASSMVAVGPDTLLVGLLHLDREDGWVSAGGAVVEVDCTSQAVTRSWDFASPSVHAHPSDDDAVLIAEEGVGLHVLDLTTGATEPRVTAADLGGDVVGLAGAGDRLVVGTATEDYGFGVACVDLGAGTVTAWEPVASYLTSVDANDRGEAWISARPHWTDPTAPAGALVWDIEACRAKTTDGPIETLLAPFDIAFY